MRVRVCADVDIEALLPPSARSWPLRKLKRRLWRALAQLERASAGWVQDGGCARAEESAEVIRLTMHRQRGLPCIVDDELPSSAFENSLNGEDQTGSPSLTVAPAVEQTAVLLLYTLAAKSATHDAEERALQSALDSSTLGPSSYADYTTDAALALLGSLRLLRLKPKAR